MTAQHRTDSFGGTIERRVVDLAGMGIGDGIAGDGAHAETLDGVETGRAQMAVVEAQHLGLTVFKEQFTIIGPAQRIGDPAFEPAAIQRTRGEEGIGGGGGCVIGHGGAFMSEERGRGRSRGRPAGGGPAAAGAADREPSVTRCPCGIPSQWKLHRD